MDDTQRTFKTQTPSLPRSGGEGWGEEALIVNNRDFIGFQFKSPSLRLSPRKNFCGERGLKARRVG